MHPYFNEKASALYFLNSVADFTQLILWFYRHSADVSCVFAGKYEALQALSQRAVLSTLVLALWKLCW